MDWPMWALLGVGKNGLQQGRGDEDAVPLSQGLKRFCAMDTLSLMKLVDPFSEYVFKHIKKKNP